MSQPSSKPPPQGEEAGGYTRLPVRAWREGKLRELEDCVAEEAPVALVYNGEPHVVMMATPLDLEDFALGFSYSEGVIEGRDELESLEVFRHEGGRSHE